MVKTIYYLDVDLYRYFIGRSDQSVNETVMLSRIDQNIRVNKLMLDVYAKANVPEKKKRAYMLKFLEIVVTVSSILLVKGGSDEQLAKKQQLWDDIRRDYPDVYRQLRRRPLGIALHLPGKVGRKIMVWGYTIAQKVVGFN
jgi:hypothetical protein